MRKLITEGNLASIDLTDAKITSGGEAYYQSYRTSLNAIGAYAFDSFKKLLSVRLPLRTTSIGDRAFRFSGLKMIEIPDAVTSIGLEAFGGSESLTTVIIGKKVRTISQGVFYNTPVKDVYVKALTPPTLSDYIFNSNPTIHVYSSALSKYQASNWTKFGTIVGDLTDEIIDGLTPDPSPRRGEEMVNGKLSNGKCFDLTGRKVYEMKPGIIYIKNDKKIMIDK